MFLEIRARLAVSHITTDRKLTYSSVEPAANAWAPARRKNEMKYVLLIFGIALVFAGAVSIYSGYGIIEVERGWATVIAGATGLTGGIITISLAWILGSLDRLRAALEAREPAEAFDLPVAPATSSIRETTLGQQREEPLLGRVGHAGAEIAELAEWDSEPPAAPPVPAVAMQPQAREPTAKIPPLPRASSAFVSAAAKARTEPRAEPSVSELWRRVGVNLDVAKSEKPAGALEAVAPNRQAHQAGSETEADWLDQALARFDAAIGPESPETSEEAPPLAPNSSAEQPAGPQPEVIGRYEAEGTAYVMYADGSIDAQSEQGILRFKSLAELKAFFQS
jgi:hypothetical protein